MTARSVAWTTSPPKLSRVNIVFRGLALWPPLFSPHKMAAKNHRLSWHCRFNLPNFQTVFSQDRNKNGGGVCIFVSDQLSCSRRSDLESQDLELLWVEVFLQQSPRTQHPLLIGCCYRPPNLPMHFYEKLETTLDNVVTKNILLLGEFNAKRQEWCSRDLATRHGNALKDLMDSYGLTQLCTKPTHLNHEGKPNSLLDLVFTNDTDTFHSSVDVLPPIGTSDHLPVVHYCPAKDNLSQYNQYPSKKMEFFTKT